MNTEKLVSIIRRAYTAYPDKVFSQKGANYTCINPYSYGILRKYQDLIDNFDGIFVDGISMCWWIRIFYGIKVPRLSFDMTTIAKDFFETLSANGQSVYFIGAKDEEVSETVRLIKEEYPNLNILGFRNGFFKDSEERKLSINTIVKKNPDFVVIGMGTPLQEQYMIDLRNAGFKGTSFTCGGYLRQASKGIHYFPDWVDRYNLRGIYRQFKEKGIFKRNYNTLIQFPILFTYDSIKSKITKSK